ncbi:hypothetical protein F511_21886 [Dorcoceras hygrometricum]|uniref:Uncharacterized protein n=1 Tax=Dorcoceras hygrometricum TaxID=472368 RepID=A0A2Z7BWC3_9LAMI|nr:hypothetical protein F511_21886 [Dorcoceras hygrometricum]
MACTAATSRARVLRSVDQAVHPGGGSGRPVAQHRASSSASKIPAVCSSGRPVQRNRAAQFARPACGHAPPLARPARTSSHNGRSTIIDQRCSNGRPSCVKFLQASPINAATSRSDCEKRRPSMRGQRTCTARVCARGGAPPSAAAISAGISTSCFVSILKIEDCGSLRQSGPRPDPKLLRQAALEALTRSARTDSPRRIGRKQISGDDRRRRRHVGGGGGGVFERGRRRFWCLGLGLYYERIQLVVGPQPLWLRNHNSGPAQRIMVKRLATSPHDPLGITDSACKNQSVVVSVQYGPFNPYIPIRSTTIDSIGYPRMSASGESSTTMHRILHTSGSHPIPTPYDPKTNQYNQDLGLIHSTNGNHLESPNEGSSIDHQVTIYLHAQNITMFPTNETWYFASQILVSNSGGLILILTAQSTRNMFRIHSDY